MKDSNQEYIPGVCNIGKVEVAQRNRIGWIGMIVTIALMGIFYALHLSPLFGLLLFFPAFISAIGLVQGLMHFCVAFGLKGIFNFGSELHKTDTVMQAEFRAQDKKKAVQILIYSMLIGLIVALVGYFIL